VSGSNDYEVFFEGCCRLAGTEFAGFTGTKVQILTLKALRAAAAFQALHRLALLVHKYKY
jgi:hypothetical protein